MGLLWSYIKRYPRFLLLNLIGVSGAVLINLGLPTVLARMIDTAILPADYAKLYYLSAIMAVIVIMGLLGRTLSAYASSKITTKMIKELRNDLFKHTQMYSNQEFENIGVPSLITRVTNDAFVLMQFSEMALRLGFITPLMFIGSIAMILITSPSLAWTVIIAIPFVIAAIYFVAKRAKPLSEEQQKSLDRINQYARENLTGLRVIRAFAREDYQEKRFKQETINYSNVAAKLFKLIGALNPVFFHIAVWITILIVIFSMQPLEQGSFQIGTVVAFIEYAFHALYSILMFSQLFVMYPRMAVSARRLQEILDVSPSIDDNLEGVTETKTAGYIEFENVAFAYPGETENPVLQDINFSAKPGETVAFIGSTGSGKSTLIRLIPRMFDVTFGKITIDGVNIRDYNLKALRQKIGFVPQKANLFTGTIAENLRFGSPYATDEDLDFATDISQAKDFISKMDKGYDSYMAEGGTNLSGGQKQRMSIARAIVKKPAIYIFDDSFSALDYKTEAILRKRLKEITQDATVLIVAQRISTIINADRIIVMNEGQIVGQGSHDELMASNEIYQAIAKSQFKTEAKAE